MPDVTEVLQSVEAGDPKAADELLPLVYDELRKLAAAKMAQETPGQTLSATSLVHEAYVRLVEVNEAQRWENRRHFFAAAAEAMRRILVENARRKQALKHGGPRERHDMIELDVSIGPPDGRLLDLDDVLAGLAEQEPEIAELVKLRYFVGFTVPEAAEALGISARTAKRNWTYARAWLRRELGGWADDDR